MLIKTVATSTSLPTADVRTAANSRHHFSKGNVADSIRGLDLADLWLQVVAELLECSVEMHQALLAWLLLMLAAAEAGGTHCCIHSEPSSS